MGKIHFERLFISGEFVQHLLTELFTHMEQEKHSAENQQRAA